MLVREKRTCKKDPFYIIDIIQILRVEKLKLSLEVVVFLS